MYARVTRVCEEFAFARSDHPLPDGSFAKANGPSETHDIFVHRAALVRPDDFGRLTRGARIKIQRVITAPGRGLRAVGVEVVS